MIYFPTHWGAKELQNLPNHRVVKLVFYAVIVDNSSFQLWLLLIENSSETPRGFPQCRNDCSIYITSFQRVVKGGIAKFVDGKSWDLLRFQNSSGFLFG